MLRLSKALILSLGCLIFGAPAFAAGAQPATDSPYVEVTAVRQSWPSCGEAWVSFKKEMDRLGIKGTFDPNSVEVFPVSDSGGVADRPVPCRFVPISSYNETTNPTGHVVWAVAGDGIGAADMAFDDEGYLILKSTKARQHKFKSAYRICFDVKQDSSKPSPAAEGVPGRGEIFPNGGLEEATRPGVPDLLKDFNPRRMSLDTAITHSGRQSLRVDPSKEDKYYATSFGIFDLRVEGDRNYVVGFWGRAQGTDTNVSCVSSVAWYDRNHQYIRDKDKHLIQTIIVVIKTDFNWTYFEKTVTAPKDACFMGFSVSTWSKVGHLWVDDMTARPQVLPDDPIEAERMKIESTTYKDLALLSDVSEEVVTPHVDWMKPSAAGKIKTLYLAQIRKDNDGNARNLVEFAQRMDLDWTFLPVLKHRIPVQHVYSISLTDELEPYTLAVLKSRLKTRYELIVVDRVDFKGVQKEFSDLLLGAAAQGAGVFFLDCANLPETVKTALHSKQFDSPINFAIMPEISGRLTLAAATPNLYQLTEYQKGRLAAMTREERLYPCIPPGQLRYRIDTLAAAFPGWEYRFLPWMKTMLWLAGNTAPVRISAVECAGDKLNFTLEGAASAGSSLELILRDSFNRVSPPWKYPLPSAAAKHFTAPLTQLAGGVHVAEYRLLDSAGKVMDFGAASFTVPAACDITSLATDQRFYRQGKPVTVAAEFARVPAGAKFAVEVWDMNGRLVQRLTSDLAAGQPKAEVKFDLPAPLTIIHRAFASVIAGDATLAEKMIEFSTPDNYPKDDEFCAYLWEGGPQMAQGYLAALKNAGFDSILLEPSRMSYSGDAIVHAGLRPWGYDLGLGRLEHIGVGQYHGDDLIRVPCFSNPDFWKAGAANAKKYAPEMVYFGVRDCMLTDELEIGPVVCFCPYCMARFRERLQKLYPDLAALNREWGTAFNSWDAVKPYTLKETQEKKAPIASWLDHKMFMTIVFAGLVGQTGELYRPDFPEIKVGLSGTQNPGFSYNWWEFLKVAECIGNYGGIQNDLIRSFKRPGTRIGQWAGGYALPWENAEKYARNMPWSQVFSGSGCYYFFQGDCFGMRGDLRLDANARTAFEEIEAIRGGIDKLLLSSGAHDDGIAVHYSPASCFAAIAAKNERIWGNTLDAWKYLLDDLGLAFRFVSYDQLEKGELRAGKYKVMILPLSTCLSVKEVQGLTAFVKDGGVVIADYSPGLFDEHGNVSGNADVTRLFGVERAQGETAAAEAGLAIADVPALGLKARTIKIRCADEGLRLTTGKAAGDFAGKPALIVNELGKGRAILLNCVMHDYAKSDLTGGGETQLIGRGDPALTTPMRELVGDLLAGAGVRPPVSVATRKGVNFQPLLKTTLFESGALRYVAFLKANSDSKPILPEERVPVVVNLGSPSHVYDVRAGKYLGHTAQFDAVIAPSVGQVFALLPYQVESVSVTAADAARGGNLSAAIVVNAAGGVARHAVTVRFIGPDKQEVRLYRTKALLEKGEGTVTIRFALNDAPGAWTIRATDVASGTVGEAGFTLK